MVGRPMDAVFPEPAPAPADDVLLEVEAWSRRPPCMQASLTVRKGEILGIAGLIGSGRTEIIRALMGLEPVAAGRVRLRNREVSARRAPPGARIRGGAGYLSEDRKGEGLALTMSLADNITCTRYDACSTSGWLQLGAAARAGRDAGFGRSQ